MKKKLWENCEKCDSECCKSHIVTTIFTTPEEKKMLPRINEQYPCYYLGKNNLCAIHNKRPLDCRMHPFDIISENNKYYWVIWNDFDKCPLLNEERNRFEEYLKDIEKNIIPKLKKCIKEFDNWKDDEYKEWYKYEILREVRM
jgi:Fe-S-cluster containining protein